MEFIFEFFFELVVEIFGEAFFSAGGEFVPDEKLLGKKKKLVTGIVIVTSLVLLICLIIGGVMLLETKGTSVLGKILVGFPIVYFVMGVMLKVKRAIKHK